MSTLKYDGNQQAGDAVFNAASQTTSINIGTAGANQVTEDYTFDSQTGLLTNQKALKTGQTLLDLSYEYNRNNSVGTLNGKTGHLSKTVNNLDNNKNREYEYDALGRLMKAKGGNGGNLWTQQYSYDRYGNRTNVTGTGVAADNTPIPSDGIPNLSYNSTTNRITTAGFEYDVAGNQTRALAEDGVSWLRFEYDAANRLRFVRRDDGSYVQAFEYGASNARVASWDYQTSQLTIYAGTLAEYTEFTANVPTWTKSFTYLGDSALSTITPNGQGGEYTEYNHPDRLGTRVITNQQSGTSYEQASLPFGTALNAESTISTNKKRFTSYDRSEKTGLDYAINRTYDSKQGRFTSVDPIGMSSVSLSAPQTLNLYTYCGNDPINHTDPSGLFWGFLKKLFKWVMVAVAVVVAIITIVSAPATIAGFLGAISAGANAASQIMNAAGFKKIGMIFGLIAVATGIGSIISGKMGLKFLAENGGKKGIFGAGVWFATLGSVGAIKDFAQTKDKKKKRPGKFQTVDQAAIYWLQVFNKLSNQDRKEYAVSICEIQSTGEIVFSSTDLNGTIDSSNPPECDSGQKQVGVAHTHPASPIHRSEEFSRKPGDRLYSNNRSIRNGGVTPVYVGTPSGKIKKFIPTVILGSDRGKVITLKSKAPI